MTNQEKINQYQEAIKLAEETLDNPYAPEVAYAAAEKVITSLSNKNLKLKSSGKPLPTKKVNEEKQSSVRDTISSIITLQSEIEKQEEFLNHPLVLSTTHDLIAESVQFLKRERFNLEQTLIR